MRKSLHEKDPLYRVAYRTVEVDTLGAAIVGSISAVDPIGYGPYASLRAAQRKVKDIEGQLEEFNLMFRSEPGKPQVRFFGYIEICTNPQWKRI